MDDVRLAREREKKSKTSIIVSTREIDLKKHHHKNKYIYLPGHSLSVVPSGPRRFVGLLHFRTYYSSETITIMDVGRADSEYAGNACSAE